MGVYARYKSGGKYLSNTLWVTTGDTQPPESHIEDFATAFGLPADQIECEVTSWDGVSPLPKEDEPDAHERLPVAVPPPEPPTRDERLAALFDVIKNDSALSATTKGAIAKAADELRSE